MPRLNGKTLPTVQYITHASDHFSRVESARLALECGLSWIQYRCKDTLSYPRLREEALAVQTLCRRYNALFVVDDFVELAAEIEADGVHLGKNDMPVAQARKRLGGRFLIGGTANTLEDIEDIHTQGGDYIGLGPFRFTATKEKLSPILGLEGYRRIMEGMVQKSLALPVFAIGGIRPEDAAALKSCGLYGIALSSALSGSSRPAEDAQVFLQTFKSE